MDNPNPQPSVSSDKVVSSNLLGIAYPLVILIFIVSLLGVLLISNLFRKKVDATASQGDLIRQQAVDIQGITIGLQGYQKDLKDGKSGDASLAEIKPASERFQEVLNGMENGAEIKLRNGKSYTFEKLNNPTQISEIKIIKDLWSPLIEKVQKVLVEKSDSGSLEEAVTLGRVSSKKIADSCLALYDDVKKQDAIQGRGLSIVRGFLIGLAMICLFLIPVIYLVKRAANEQKIAQAALSNLNVNQGELSTLSFAKAETDRIMETVQEGLFLVDENGTIGDYYSNELPKIFRQEELAGLSLYGILQRHLSDKMYTASRDFFALLFDSSRKEKMVLKVNPLTDVEVNFPDPDGGFLTRFLGFSFRRIMDGDKVDRLFVAVRDVTVQVQLENKLRESEKSKERELELLLSIIHLPQGDLENFIALAENELETVTNALRAEDFATNEGKQVVLRDQLQKVFNSIHNLNGNAALLRLTYFQKAAHEFETQIKKGLDKPTLNGDDFITIIVSQAALKADLVNLQELSSKLRNMGGVAVVAEKADTHEIATSALADQLRQLVTETALNLGKSASLNVDEFALHAFAHGRTDLVRDVLVQLSRNAVAHGVETHEARKIKGKDPVAQLSIHALPSPAAGVIGLALRDDGQGLDMERIRLRAEEVGLLPVNHPATQPELIKCIFEPCFSTSSQVDLHSGRGVGMAIVKSKMVDEAGGCIEVITVPDQFCEFRLYLRA